MSEEGSISYRSLKNTSKIMQYEILISRPGISEPDSSFIWASTFTAPLGISIHGDEVYFDLFLPAGAENEGDKKLFLNRVGAIYQDGIWQVRRTHEQMKNIYGPMLKQTLTSSRTLFMDYAYIEKGRVYLHTLFNEKDLPLISRTILSIDSKSLDLRLEYLRKLKSDSTAFENLRHEGENTSVTIEAIIQGSSSESTQLTEKAQFLMGSAMDKGVRTVAYASEGNIPEILKPINMEKIDEHVFSFLSTNEIVVKLMEFMIEQNTVFYGYHGYATENSLTITVNLPKPLTTSLLRVMGKLVEKVPQYEIRLKEVADLASP